MRGKMFGPLHKVGLASHIRNGNWVCAILDEGRWWNHLRGITRRETSVTMCKPADHRGRSKTGEDVVARNWRGNPSLFSFIENGTDPGNFGEVWTYDLGSGVLGEELWMWKRNRGMFVHGVSTPSSYGG